MKELIKKHILFLFCFVCSLTTSTGQSSVDSIGTQHKFFNLAFIGIVSTNGDKMKETTNNVSLGLIYANSRNLHGFGVAPFNYVENELRGVQIGITNYASSMRGVQLGIANGSDRQEGLQVGMFNFNKDLRGVQIGAFNERKNGNGLQVGILNISSNENDYPIGFVNISKNGEMNTGLMIDEMANAIANFRSGGRRTYGIAGMGYSANSPHNQLVFEAGVGAHFHISKRLKVDTEMVMSSFSKVYIEMRKMGEENKKKDDKDYFTAQKFTFRFLPSYRVGRLKVMAGPTLNYMYTHSKENEELFPSKYLWRDFDSKSSLRQLHLGWAVGVNYCIK